MGKYSKLGEFFLRLDGKRLVGRGSIYSCTCHTYIYYIEMQQL